VLDWYQILVCSASFWGELYLLVPDCFFYSARLLLLVPDRFFHSTRLISR
jgi:hypothetical protein